MEFYIKKGATLPTLKFQVVKDGRSDYHRFYNYVTGDTLFFSMVDSTTKIPKIITRKGKFVKSEVDDEYYATYRFRNFDTNKAGRFEGQFLIKTDEGTIGLDLKEKIFINVVETIIPDQFDGNGGGCYTTDNPCCPVPSFTPSNTPSVTPTPSITPTPTLTPTPTTP